MSDTQEIFKGWVRCSSLKNELVHKSELENPPKGLNSDELVDWWQDQAIAAIKEDLVAREKLGNIINCNSRWEEIIEGVEKLNRMHFEGNKEPDENERKCLVCSAPVACIIDPEDTYSEGTILKGIAGYGSCDDGDAVQAVICSRCVQNAYKDNRLEFLGNAMFHTSPEEHKELLTWTHDKWTPSPVYDTIIDTAHQRGINSSKPEREVADLQAALKICLDIMPDHLKQTMENRFREEL